MAYSKYKSRKWLITVWAILTISILMAFSIYTRYSTDWLGIALPLLIAIPNAFIIGDSITKKKKLDE